MGQRRRNNRYGHPKPEWRIWGDDETKHYEIRAGLTVLSSWRCTRAEALATLHAWQQSGYPYARLHVVGF